MAGLTDIFDTVGSTLKAVIDLGTALILVFLILDILFTTNFVIGNITTIVASLSENGVAGLIALLLLLLLYRR